MLRFAVRLLIGGFLAAPALLANAAEYESSWPQWRGPHADGSATGNPPTIWDPDTNIKWKTPIPGKSSSTPIVWGDRVFALTAVSTQRRAPNSNTALERNVAGQRRGGRGRLRRPVPEHYFQFVVLCLDRQSGTVLWDKVAREAAPHEGGHPTNSFASGSPVTDGRHLYAFFGSQGLYCYDLDGNLDWSKDLGNMRTRNGFGEGTSPTLADDMLIVNWDHEDRSFIVALDAATGAELWRRDRDEPTTWNTPLVVEHNGRKQIVLNGTNRARGYDLRTGDLLWECGGQVTNPIPSPVALDGIVFCMSGYRGAAAYAIPLGARGDITNSQEIVWRRGQGTPYVPSPLLYNGRLYFTKGNSAILSSLDARTGEPIIDQVRLPGLNSIYASPVGVADYIYITGRDGTTVVIRHGDQLDVVSTNQIGESVDASPAVVDNEIFLRSDSHLYCIAE